MNAELQHRAQIQTHLALMLPLHRLDSNMKLVNDLLVFFYGGIELTLERRDLREELDALGLSVAECVKL